MIFYPQEDLCSWHDQGSLPDCLQATGALLGRGENPCLVAGNFDEPPAPEVVWQQSSFIGS